MTDKDRPNRSTQDTGAGVAGVHRPRAVPSPGGEPITIAKSLTDLDWRRAIVIAAVAAVFGFIGTFAVGSIGDVQGYRLLQGIKPTTSTLCFVAIAASSTVLALMMTALTIGKGWAHSFKPEHYNRIRQIALLATIAIIVALFLMLFLNVPIREAEAFDQWYSSIYYAVIILASLIGGIMVSMTILLYNTIVILIMAVDPHIDTSDILE
jgi:hypothetical protein